MTKGTLAAVAGGAAMILGLSAWVTLQGPGDAQYRTAPVECGDIAYTVSATGTPNAVVTVLVGSQVSGNILALYADFNTKVRKGQVVARIDPQIFQARVDQAKATLNASEAAVVNAQAQIGAMIPRALAPAIAAEVARPARKLCPAQAPTWRPAAAGQKCSPGRREAGR